MLGRRKFLRGSVLAAGAASVPFQALFTRTARAQESPFGPLVSDPDGVLDLPAGFSYAILEHVGDPMDDGLQVPGRPDGMGAFMADDGLVVLMRNHENSRGGGPGARPPETYREGDGFEGGVSRLVVDPSDERRKTAQATQDVTIHEEPVTTADGTDIEIAANVGQPAELEGAKAQGADGIGLYRTEFLFLDRERAPDEA